LTLAHSGLAKLSRPSNLKKRTNQRPSEMLCGRKGVRAVRAYDDADGLHLLGAAESDISGYIAITSIRRRGGILVLPTQCDRNEAIAPHKHARAGPPARARRSNERAL
jgi:hypothetical protein